MVYRYSGHVPGQSDVDPLTPRVSVVNVANALTGLRIVLVPVFLVALFVGDGHESYWRVVAFIIFHGDE